MRGDETIELTIVYETVEGGHLQASVPTLPRTITTGRTRAEARRNVRDALRMMLASVPEAVRDAQDTKPLELRIRPCTRSRDLGRDLDR